MNSPVFDAPDLETMNRLLPAFEFKAVIASNEYGAVYFARQRSLERDVAIKFLAPSVSESSGFRQSFESTARMMAKLNHPNLIGVYDSGFVEGMLYFVMEFVPGKSLDHSSRGQQVQTTQAVRLVSGICDGLAHAQDHGIVHGNLNPANILLNQKAEPKIGNFGFAHPKEAAARSETAARLTAPEVTANPASADSRADIYSVGAILYELVTAKPHGPGAAPPSELSNCGAGLDAIWRQATDRDPARRFSNMRAFHKALGDFLNASQKAKAGPVPPGAAVRPPLAAMQMPVQKLPPKKRVHSGLMVQLAILVGLMIATPVIWKKLEKSRDDKAQAERDARVKAADAKRDAFDEELRRAQEISRRNKEPEPVKPAVPEPEPAKETPAQSLTRLREALASGDRTEMPGGSIHQGDNDRKSKPGPATETTNVEISTLMSRAKDLILAADRKRSEKLTANARKVSWDLDIYLRNLPKSDRSTWETQVTRLKNCAVNNRLPTSIPRSSGIRLSEKMARIAEDGAIQQGEIDAEFLVDTEKIRIAYIAKLRDALARAESSGQRLLAQSLGESLANSANLADWLRSFDVDPKPENPVPGQIENTPLAPRKTRVNPVPNGGGSFVE